MLFCPLEENVLPISQYPKVDENQCYKSHGLLINSNTINKADMASIKRHLMNTGSVVCEFYRLTGRQYIYEPDNIGVNHAVSIVGWDDNCSKDKFKSKNGDTPPGDGAWIIKEHSGETDVWLLSLGESFYSDGYYYIFYYDATFSNIYSLEIADEYTYDKIYQYDGARPSYASGSYYSDSQSKTISTANIYIIKDNETLTSMSFYTYDTNVPYRLAIYTDFKDGEPNSGTLVTSVTGIAEYEGYHTVYLNGPLKLDVGTQFAAVVTLGCGDTQDSPRTAVQDCTDDLDKLSFILSDSDNSGTAWKVKNDYTGCIKVQSRNDLCIDESNFPDDNFREFVIQYDTDNNGYLDYTEIYPVTSMNASNRNISDFTGIEHFTMLKEFNCSDNTLANINIHHNTNLENFITTECENHSFGESYSFDDEHHYRVCSVCGKKEYFTHDLGEIEQQSDWHYRQCVDCGNSIRYEHTFSDWEYCNKFVHQSYCTECNYWNVEEHEFL